MKNVFLFAIICGIGFWLGGTIASCIFFGVITLLGFIFMVESISFLKFIVYKSNAFIDIILFIFTLIATAKFGVTIAGGLTIAGLGFSMVYAPYMREQIKNKKSKKQKHDIMY